MQKRHAHAGAADCSQTHLQWRLCERVCVRNTEQDSKCIAKASKVDLWWANVRSSNLIDDFHQNQAYSVIILI